MKRTFAFLLALASLLAGCAPAPAGPADTSAAGVSSSQPPAQSQPAAEPEPAPGARAGTRT